MKERLEQIKHIENMISDLNKAINNANQFGDEETVKAINNQINRYREVLQSLKNELEDQEREAQREARKPQQIKELQEEIVYWEQVINTVKSSDKKADIAEHINLLQSKLAQLQGQETIEESKEVEEQVVRVFNNKLEGKITLENNNLGLYQSCTEDELVVVEANLLSSAKELGIKIRFEHEYNKAQEVVEESKSKRFESFEELRSSVRKGDIITLVETTELLNGEFTARTYKLRVDRVNKKTVSMTNLTSDFTFKLDDITNEFCYSVKREYFYTEEYNEPKEDKIKVVVKKPGDTHGQIVEIDNRLEELQSIVEGYIEVFPLTEDILIILNEEGKLQDLKPNIFVSNGEGFELIVGNIVIVADKGEDFGSLNDEQMDQLFELGILDNRHIEDFLNL